MFKLEFGYYTHFLGILEDTRPRRQGEQVLCSNIFLFIYIFIYLFISITVDFNHIIIELLIDFKTNPEKLFLFECQI